MSFLNIVRKELREMLTLKVVLPVIIMSLLMSVFGNTIGDIKTEVEKKPVIGLVVEDKGDIGIIAGKLMEERTKVVYNGTDEVEGLKEVRSKGGAALVIVDRNFTSAIRSNSSGKIQIIWIMKGTGIMDSIPSGSLTSIIDTVSAIMSYTLIDKNNTVDPAIAVDPIVRNETTIFRDERIEDTSPGTISGIMMTQTFLIPIITMMVIMMAGGSVISSMGQEKENKTLETLLTMPISRTTIVSGKIAGSAIVGLIMAAIYMFGFSRYMSSFDSSGTAMDDLGISLHSYDYILVGLSLFISLFAGLALCMILGTFAKNYKSAQFLLFPVSVLTLIPMIVLMMKDFDSLSIWMKVLVFAIPFSHPMMSVRFLMFGQYGLVIAGLGYLVLFSCGLVALAVHIFKSDRLITGSPPGWFDRVYKVLRKRKE